MMMIEDRQNNSMARMTVEKVQEEVLEVVGKAKANSKKMK
jgi:hypothetical protein